VSRPDGWWPFVFLPSALTAVTLLVGALRPSPRTYLAALLLIATIAVGLRIVYGHPWLQTSLWIGLLWAATLFLAIVVNPALSIGASSRGKHVTPTFRCRALPVAPGRTGISLELSVTNAQVDYVAQITWDGPDDPHCEIAADWLTGSAAYLSSLGATDRDLYSVACSLAAKFPLVMVGIHEHQAREWLVGALLTFADAPDGPPTANVLESCVGCRPWLIRVPPEKEQRITIPLDESANSMPTRVRVFYAPLAYTQDSMPAPPVRWEEVAPITLATVGVTTHDS
jgi:hypothetical protein